MKTCSYKVYNPETEEDEPCGNLVEGNTDGCASHNAFLRKLKKQNERAEEKKSKQISKQAERNKIARKRINPMSEKRMTEKEIYDEKREQFLLTRWCAYHGHGCIPTTVHHAKGRIGSLYLDERYWRALCMSAHEWVEKNPDKAKELGLSESRLATIKPTI